VSQNLTLGEGGHGENADDDDENQFDGAVDGCDGDDGDGVRLAVSHLGQPEQRKWRVPG
jgi:hypothetical protein